MHATNEVHLQIFRRLDALEHRMTVSESRQSHTEIMSALHAISAQVTTVGETMRQSIMDLNTNLTAFYVKFDAWVAAANANQTASDAIIAAAVAASQAGDDVDLAKVQADLKAESDKVGEPPAKPAVEPAVEPPVEPPVA